MATINVRRDVKDSFYRYKMPRLLSKIEGKGNGIKTVVPNMAEIARALSRPPSYPTKYFGCELGAQVKCDDKNERYIVNGEHDAERLQTILDGFISKFVLCASCRNPETDLIIKNDDIMMDCKACGAQNMADMRHKLSTYIVKNPPAQASKNQRKQRKAATAQTNDLGGGFDDNEGGSDDDIISQRINKEAAGLTMQSQLAQEDWSEDTSAAAVAQRLKELAVKGVGAFGDDNDDDDENKYDLFGAWLEEQVDNTNDSNAVTDVSIILKAQELGVYGKYKACQVLVQCIFDESIATQIPKRTKLLRKFVTGEKHQKAVLGGVERLVGLEYKDSLMKKVPAILMKLYDADVIDDEVFIKWGEKPTKKYVAKDVSKEVKKAAKPFLEWIATASEEESEEESD
ncbi:hypothetical protein [Absidia glauca]|uniref:W2 domain-containing protein n=1 Tax=Absidia glauca TaxID=4829 RepID=A0A168NW46_ABSGL|nr:hypothetical protein [Absidia glauca]